MAKKAKKTTDAVRKPEQEDDVFFVDESAQDYKFADYVRVSSYPHGMVLYFGKWYPEQKKFGLFEGVILPFNVANSLKKIIDNQIADLIKKGLLETRDEEEVEQK